SHAAEARHVARRGGHRNAARIPLRRAAIRGQLADPSNAGIAHRVERRPSDAVIVLAGAAEAARARILDEALAQRVPSSARRRAAARQDGADLVDAVDVGPGAGVLIKGW